VSGQENDCLERLREAEVCYNNGRMDSTLSKLLPCLEDEDAVKDMSRFDRRDMYRLTSQASIFLDNYSLADKYTRELLKLDPFYKISNDDMLLFRDRINQTRLIPKSRFGVTGGVLHMQPEVIQQISLFGPYDLGGMGPIGTPFFGFQYEYNVLPGTWLGSELIFGQSVHYKYIMVDYTGSVVGQTGLNMAFLKLPVYLNYNILQNKRFSPYVKVGGLVALSYLKNYYNAESRVSDSYGKYYYNREILDLTGASTGIARIAFFYERSLVFNLFTGLGVMGRFRRTNIALDFRYIPTLSRKDPLGGLLSLEDIDETDFLSTFDDLRVIRMRNYFQVSTTVSINLNYKTN